MVNPFEDVGYDFEVLVNDENQHSLWPSFVAIPLGWKSVHGPATRSECLRYVEDNWKNIRPKSLSS